MRKHPLEAIRNDASDIFKLLEMNFLVVGRQRLQENLQNVEVKKIDLLKDNVRQIVKQLHPDFGKLRKSRRLDRRIYVADGPNFV